MRNIISKTEIALGAAIVALAVLVHLVGYFCIGGSASCGMVEPILAMYGLLIGNGLLVAGLASRFGTSVAAIGHLPLACSLLYLATVA
jgi:hypothetical protein